MFEEKNTLEIELLSVLRERFKFSAFRPGQLDILHSVLQGRDSMAVMPTGGGKSLCFQLPALFLKGIVVVISPLISLMKDQVRNLKKIGVPAGCLYSGQKYSEKREVFAELKCSDHFILYLSPERVQKPGFAHWLKDKNISLFAIDEAHCISQWGPEFREDYHRLTLLREIRPEVPILATTATATPPVLRDIRSRLQLNQPDRHIYGFYRPNLYYQVELCENSEFKLTMVKQALRQTSQGRILIYCGTRKQCESLVTELEGEFPAMAYYHAGLETPRRNQIQKQYEEGSVRILAATNAFGMGIDHPDVRLVLHYQMPANIESLYQEMGRAGRDGESSTCLLLYSRKDKGLHSFFIRQSEGPPQYIRQRWNALETLSLFAEGAECRHAGILTYFHDSKRLESCGHCDICAPDSERRVVRPVAPSVAENFLPKRRRKFLSEEPLSAEAIGRAEVLRQWRRMYAAAEDLPAFMVFSNKTLHDLAQKAPESLQELERIYGLGPRKIEQFGEFLLAALKDPPSRSD